MQPLRTILQRGFESYAQGFVRAKGEHTIRNLAEEGDDNAAIEGALTDGGVECGDWFVSDGAGDLHADFDSINGIACDDLGSSG